MKIYKPLGLVLTAVYNLLTAIPQGTYPTSERI